MSVENRHKSPVLLRPYLVIPVFLFSSTVLFIVNKGPFRGWGKRGQVGQSPITSTYPHGSIYPHEVSAQSKSLIVHGLFLDGRESLTIAVTILYTCRL